MSEQQHTCAFRWCEQGSADEPHWTQVSYTPATMGSIVPEQVSVNGFTVPTVGVGIRYQEDEGTPAIYIHLSGGPRDVDEDVYLRLDEADAVLGALQDAIGMAREAVAVGTQLNT
ncbi:hypothetical protein VX037_18105 [Gordonia sp. Z-3]|uniref:hypothetical protein n=1 Tax=Gordonia sp. Z-3 TaxID=3115408 RepID=UPI002E2A3609|nr:hypothetical protein [Gordonia sp. Z-3]MED5802941.1 hypothetical protein [Gordonia sp. Z-3]